MIPIFDMMTLNFLVGLGALLLQVASVFLVVSLIFRKRNAFASKVVSFAGSVAIPLGFLLSIGALSMSLYYSEIYGFVPCGLCWIQRTLMYPLVFIFGLAWFKRDSGVADYGILLSAGAGLIGLYQHYLQMGGGEFLPCPTTGPGADCAARIIFEFGYITFPLVAVSMSLFVILLMIALKIKTRQ